MKNRQIEPTTDSVAPETLPPLARDTSFWGMAATQFLGAFNDNLFKQLILLLATPTAANWRRKPAPIDKPRLKLSLPARF